MTINEKLLKRLEQAKAERENDSVHPKDCKCKGHGTVPAAQFSCGYVKCVL